MNNRFINKYGQFFIRDTKNRHKFIAFDFVDLSKDQIVLESNDKVTDIPGLCPEPLKSMMSDLTEGLDRGRRLAGETQYCFYLHKNNGYSPRFIQMLFIAFCYAVIPFEKDLLDHFVSEFKADLAKIASFIKNKTFDRELARIHSEFTTAQSLGSASSPSPEEQSLSKERSSSREQLVQEVFGVVINVTDDHLMIAAAEKIKALKSKLDTKQSVTLFQPTKK